MIENDTWKLVDCFQNVKTIGCELDYRIKDKSNGMNDKYKTRLVAKCFSQ